MTTKLGQMVHFQNYYGTPCVHLNADYVRRQNKLYYRIALRIDFQLLAHSEELCIF